MRRVWPLALLLLLPLAGCLGGGPGAGTAPPPLALDQEVAALAWVHVAFPLDAEAPDAAEPAVVLRANWTAPADASIARFILVTRGVSSDSGRFWPAGPSVVASGASRDEAALAVGVGGAGLATTVPLPDAAQATSAVLGAPQGPRAAATSYRLGQGAPAGATRGHLAILVENAEGWPGRVQVSAPAGAEVAWGGMEDAFAFRPADFSSAATVHAAGPLVASGLAGTFALGAEGRSLALAFRPSNRVGSGVAGADAASTQATLQRPDGSGERLSAPGAFVDWSGLHGPWTFAVEASASDDQFDRPLVFGVALPRGDGPPPPPGRPA